MGKTYLLDSNVIIGYLGNKLPLGGMVFVSDIVNKILLNVPLFSRCSLVGF
jgi:hypothetical protein